MNSPTVKLSELAPPRVTIQCLEYATCGLMTRIYRVEPQPNGTIPGAFAYCPRCGTNNVQVGRSSDTDTWEAYARDYGLPVPVMQQLYRLWNPHTHTRFSDFVAELREEALAGRLKEREPTTVETPSPTRAMPRLVIPGRVG
jgi:hypothetical protein